MNAATLQLLLRGLSQRPAALHLLPGLPRPVLAPTQLLLPAEAPSALQLAAVAHATAHLLHSPAGQDPRGRKPLALAVLSALEDARVERLLIASAPGARRWFATFLARPAPTGLGFAALMDRLDRVLADPQAHDGHHWLQRAQQGFWSLPADAPPDAFAQLALVLANMLGQMRVPFDTQYRPRAAYRDDHSYLWNHGRDDGEPLPAMDGTCAGPSGEATAAAPPPQRERHYGEWHEKLGLWRAGWCRVQERSLVQRALPSSARPRRTPRSDEGDALDLAAAVAALADRRRGATWDTRLLLRTALPARASVLLLLDLSQSTRAPWGAGPLTVQAAQQQTALQLARQLAARGVRVAVHGFASNGRHAIAYWRAVDFGMACDAAALASLPVRHSTRLGAALRHAQALLAEEPGTRRSLLLLSDGQPWDIDVFETSHLLQDARQAVQAVRSAGVRVACIVSQPQGLAELAPVFGPAGLHRLDATASAMRWLLAGYRDFPGA